MSINTNLHLIQNIGHMDTPVTMNGIVTLTSYQDKEIDLTRNHLSYLNLNLNIAHLTFIKSSSNS